MGSYRALVLVIILSIFLNYASCDSEIKDENRVYIACVDGSKKPTKYSNAWEWYNAILKSLKGASHIIHVYKTFNDFVKKKKKLIKEQVEELKAHPKILMLILEKFHHYDILVILHIGSHIHHCHEHHNVSY